MKRDAPDSKWRSGPCLIWALAGLGFLGSIGYSIYAVIN